MPYRAPSVGTETSPTRPLRGSEEGASQKVHLNHGGCAPPSTKGYSDASPVATHSRHHSGGACPLISRETKSCLFDTFGVHRLHPLCNTPLYPLYMIVAKPVYPLIHKGCRCTYTHC